MLRELAWRAPAVADATLASVFFGGGTPSLWAPAQLGRVLHAIRSSFAREVDALEITVECNPSSLDRAGARALREAGANRLSIGVQSLDGPELRFLGRLHDAELALRAVEGALAEVPRVSADLMFGLPNQPAERSGEHARRLLGLGLSHLSLYALTIEPDTQFGKLHQKGRLPIAREDDVAANFEQIEAVMSEAGFEHYEVSNYARPGERARHNEHYWRGGAYLGLGAGAVGCLRHAPGQARRYRNDPKPEQYMQRSGSAEVEVFEEPLDAQDIIREQLMLGLRTSDGVDLQRLQADSGTSPLAGRERALTRLQDNGSIVLDGDLLRVPQARWLHLDGIVASLF